MPVPSAFNRSIRRLPGMLKKCAGIASCALVHADSWHKPVAQGIAHLIQIRVVPGGKFQRTPHPKTMWLIGFTGNPGARFAFCAAARWSGAHARSSTNPVLNYVSRETFARAAHRSA
ncbi:MAG: hypothetical protein DWG81_00690 [Chloroflexi bacterium]|nr:hypothetical protein [Chloroflexota bacterium]